MAVRIAIAGLGAAARNIHIPAYRSIPEIELVGGYDPVSATNLPFPTFASLEALLDATRPDIVTVATPTRAHYAVARIALERGTHVFCEKPFADTLDQAVDLIGLAGRSGVHIVVNNEFRFMRCHQSAKAAMDAGDIGDLQFINIQQTFRADAETESGWRGEDRERTCKEFGIHAFDLCRYFFDSEPIRMYARMPKPSAPDGPDMLNLIDLEFSNERFARITLDRLTRGRHRYLDIQLDGTLATIESQLGGQVQFAAGIKGRSRRPYLFVDLSLGSRATLYRGEKAKKLASDGLNIFMDATASLMRAFLDALASGTQPPCNGADNIRSFALMRNAYETAEDGGVADLNYLKELP